MQLLCPNLVNFPVLLPNFELTHYLVIRGIDIEALILVL